MSPRKKKAVAPKVKKPKAAAVELDLTSISQVDVCLAYKTLATTQEGQIVYADLVRRFGFTRTTTFVPGDPYRSQLNEGARTVVVHAGRMIDADPSEFEEPDTEM